MSAADPTPPASPVVRRRLPPVGLLVAITLGVWMAGAVWPRLLVTLGIYDYGRVYLDSYAVLAALDAVREGADPHAVNPLDVLRRPHVYSDWWLGLRWLGLGRTHNGLVGTAWIAAFALVAWVTLKPRHGREVAWVAALMISPPVLLAVNRANNDIVIFTLLAGCALATVPVWWRTAVALACLGLATGLKYFPAPAAVAFLWVRPVRRVPAMLLGALLVSAVVLASVWPQIERSRFRISSGIYTMGAPLWWRDFGWSDAQAALPGLLVLLLGAAGFAGARLTMGLAERGAPRERMLAAVGAVTLLACFMAGVNYAYRWIFALWPAYWLGRQAFEGALAGRERFAARLACALLLVCLWMDGLLCLVVNLFLTHYSQDWHNNLDIVWRQWTQPLHWLLMTMLAGWLLEAALVTLRDWWRERHAA